MQQPYAVRGAAIDLPSAGDLEGQQAPDGAVHDAEREMLTGDAERLQILLRQVDPSAPQILADVAKEVAELERDAQVCGIGIGDFAWDQRLEDRHHLQADDGRRAVDVAHQVRVGGVTGDGQVHPHAREERLDVVHRDLPAAHRVDDRPADRVVAPAGLDVLNELRPPADQPVGLLRVGERAGQVVDDLVGVTGEAVERMDVGALPVRQQQRREVVGLAVARVEPAARLVGGAQLRAGDPGGVQLLVAHGREVSQMARWGLGAAAWADPAAHNVIHFGIRLSVEAALSGVGTITMCADVTGLPCAQHPSCPHSGLPR